MLMQRAPQSRIRVLRLDMNAIMCGRNYSTFKLIHSIKTNPLEQYLSTIWLKSGMRKLGRQRKDDTKVFICLLDTTSSLMMSICYIKW